MWQRMAACAGMDPELFFPRAGELAGEARAACARCPVVQRCALEKLKLGGSHGIWAGVGGREKNARQKLLRIAGVESVSRRKPVPEKCVVCGRRLRPRNVPVAEFPGTVKHRRDGLCEACFQVRATGYLPSRRLVS